MGYYATFDYEIQGRVKVDKKKAKELEKFFGEENDDVSGFQEVELKLNSLGELIAIELGDYYRQFYDSELFAKKLSECIVEGNVFLYFIGEDGERWGYKVMPGKVEGISSLWLTEEESNLFREFIENYEEFKKWLELKQKSINETMTQMKNNAKPRRKETNFKRL